MRFRLELLYLCGVVLLVKSIAGIISAVSMSIGALGWSVMRRQAAVAEGVRPNLLLIGVAALVAVVR